jgi:hypothetical protein
MADLTGQRRALAFAVSMYRNPSEAGCSGLSPQELPHEAKVPCLGDVVQKQKTAGRMNLSPALDGVEHGLEIGGQW